MTVRASTLDMLELPPGTDVHKSGPSPIVPRILFLALDPFGSRVLDSLQNEQLGEVVPFKLELTEFVRYDFKSGRLVSRPESSVTSATQSASKEQSPQKAEAINAFNAQDLVQCLHKVRSQICSQPLQARLIREGFQVSPTFEVYILAQVSTLQHLDFLRDAVHTLKTYLERFEPVSVNAVISLAEYEGPQSSASDRAGVVEGLSELLTENMGTACSQTALSAFERCYVVTNEAIDGKSVIPHGELADRVAGFLGAHYFDSLRQPLTPYQYLLFGSKVDGEPERDEECGMCELFGYADLRFELNHVLDRCSIQESGRVLREAFLAVSDQAIGSFGDARAILDAELQAAGTTVSIDPLIQHILERSSGTPTDNAIPRIEPTSQSLAELRELRRKIDLQLHSSEEEIREKIYETEQHLTRVIMGAIDELIGTELHGLFLAEQVLDAVDASIRSEIDTARSADCMPGKVDAVHIVQMNRSWSRLAAATTAMPTLGVFWGRLGLFAVLVALGILLGGLQGLGLAAVSLLAIIAWIIYVWGRLQPRIRIAEEQLGYDLKEWHQAHLSAFAKEQLVQMLTNLRSTFARPRGSNPESASVEWKAVQEWRAKLTGAAVLCDEWDSSGRVVPCDQQDAYAPTAAPVIQSRAIVVSEKDLQQYYQRLTAWQPEVPAHLFLNKMHGSQVHWWRTCSADQVASELRRVCRKLYAEQVSPEMAGLEHYLVEVSGSGKAELGSLLDSLSHFGLPMARLHRLHAHWELPVQRLLIVHDARHSSFREFASMRGIDLIDGASPQRIIYMQTLHHIPLRDLAISHDR